MLQSWQQASDEAGTLVVVWVVMVVVQNEKPVPSPHLGCSGLFSTFLGINFTSY